jgi:S-DNA-T family DNA segregation ATPase FtsK/SpoIIIE
MSTATQRGRRSTAETNASSGRAGSSSRRRRRRSVVSGHEADLVGLGLVLVGVMIGLGVYAGGGGPVGAGLDWFAGVLVGVARVVLPVATVAVGIGVVADRREVREGRLTVGLGVSSAAVLGIVHVARGPLHGAAVDEVTAAGGIVGVAVGRPLQTLLSDTGAVVGLVVLALAGLLLATRASLRLVAGRTARGVVAVGRPGYRAARRAFEGMATLSSEREGAGVPVADDTAPAPAPTSRRRRSGGTVPLYDVESEAHGTDGAAPPAPAPERPAAPAPAARARGPRSTPALPAFLETPVSGEQLDLPLGPGADPTRWSLPSLKLLTRSAAQRVDAAEITRRAEQLTKVLRSHGIDTEWIPELTSAGPTVTRYAVRLVEDGDGRAVKMATVASLHRDIAYALEAEDVRILAPIPGKRAIGVEVPNQTRHLVTLGDLLTSAEAREATHPLEVGIGKDIAGRTVMMNLATTPHLLIAGATGAGKSSGLNCIITSLLMRTTPEQVRLILIDPKQVEMGQYGRLPHLLTQPVTNPKKAANALAWAVREMERRYDLLAEVGFRDLGGYNAAYDRGELVSDPGSERSYERLPFIVVVVDELNDLMMVAARDVEDSITRIAQKARAVGIHLIVATQRPSVNVITGVIKANIPARMAYAVSSLTDSRVILDQPGAERLVGRGDLLLLGSTSNVPQRIQGAWVTEEEVRAVVAQWRRQCPEPTYVTGVEGDDAPGAGAVPGFGGGGGHGDDEDDEALVRQAMELVVRSQLGSTSMLQRKLKVGFARAGRLMDLLEQRGVVGPSEGSKARQVLMTVEEYEAGTAGAAGIR